jgi:hypothetical protein
MQVDAGSPNGDEEFEIIKVLAVAILRCVDLNILQRNFGLDVAKKKPLDVFIALEAIYDAAVAGVCPVNIGIITNLIIRVTVGPRQLRCKRDLA